MENREFRFLKFIDDNKLVVLISFFIRIRGTLYIKLKYGKLERLD